MQIPGVQVQVPSLPPPPMLPRLVLEEPMTLTVVFVAAAAVGFFVLNRMGRARQAGACAAVCVVLVAGVQFLSRMVQTDREKIIEATGELVKATAHADTGALSPLLSPEVRFSNDFNLAAAEVSGGVWDRTEILAKVRTYLKEKYPLKETAILETQGVIDRAGVGRTQVRVRAVPEAFGFPIISWWRIDWVEKDGKWVVKGIAPMDLGLGGR